MVTQQTTIENGREIQRSHADLRSALRRIQTDAWLRGELHTLTSRTGGAVVTVETGGWVVPVLAAGVDRRRAEAQAAVYDSLVMWVKRAVNAGLLVEMGRRGDVLTLIARGGLDGQPADVNRARPVYQGGEVVA
jgi:hypothetical protein